MDPILFLVQLVIVLAVLALAWLLVEKLPVDRQFKGIILVILVVIGILYLLRMLRVF